MDLKMCESPRGVSVHQEERYRRLPDNGLMMLGNLCGNGMSVIHAICIAHTNIYNVIRNPSSFNNEARIEEAFNYICTAFECQSGVCNWRLGRETFKSLMYYGFAKTSPSVQTHILVSILVQLESFNYGNVGRDTLAYILDLFALYFLTKDDWLEYIPEKCYFPKEWIEHSVVVPALKQYYSEDIFGEIPDPLYEDDFGNQEDRLED